MSEELITSVPGMDHVQTQEPSREPQVITNPGPQTLRTAINSPHNAYGLSAPEAGAEPTVEQVVPAAQHAAEKAVEAIVGPEGTQQ